MPSIQLSGNRKGPVLRMVRTTACVAVLALPCAAAIIEDTDPAVTWSGTWQSERDSLW